MPAPVSEHLDLIKKFVEYARSLAGNEKGEAQVFCDRLFQAFGHKGYKEAGASLESRVKRRGKNPGFIDLLWAPRVLIEMKSRGENLQDHYTQAFDYWIQAVPNRPRYVVLCNFDEFWIYDFDEQLYEPKDRIPLEELPKRYTALNFLLPEQKEPQFGNNRVAVTRDAADRVATVFNSLVARGENRAQAQRFILQCVVAMFSEDIDLLPRGLFSELLEACADGESTYDALGSFFHQMNNPKPARAGRFKNVPYFNGGLFETIEPIELTKDELLLMMQAAQEDWSKVEPPIFGSLFQSSMDKEERHAQGAHFTAESEIQKVVLPTIARPWRERIDSARTLRELLSVRNDLFKFTVLDPACGSGNFLYVAYRELKRVEMYLMSRIYADFVRDVDRKVGTTSFVSTRQFYGLDTNSFAVELAKVTLMIAKKLALDEAIASSTDILNRAHQAGRSTQGDLPISVDHALPLDNLDTNIRWEDALFVEWPAASAIIGNPPYQSKNKMSDEFGADYVKKVRKRYPGVPGRANYCVYWFRRAHDELAPGHRAGLIGTNQIKSNYSREGGLDYIVKNGGTITEAVSSQVWPGDAVVHVSIVNWVKGAAKGTKRLYAQVGDHKDSPWKVDEVPVINSSLSAQIDVTSARALRANQSSNACFQGQTHGHEGFLLSLADAAKMWQDKASRSALHPYLTGDDLLRRGHPSRYCIDLNHCEDLFEAMKYGLAFEHIKKHVMPTMKENAEAERKETGKTKGPRQEHYSRWWRFWRGRSDMIGRISKLHRYITCVRHTKRPVFEFIDSAIHPNDALTLFPLADDYSFGILQSNLHWHWFQERCSPIKREWRYTSETVFDSFPWPQAPTAAQVKAVAKEGRALRHVRRAVMKAKGWNLRQLYRSTETPGRSPLIDAHESLDEAVRDAYGMGRKDGTLSFLLQLNLDLALVEAEGGKVVVPGVPPVVTDRKALLSDDRVQMPPLA